MATERTGSPGGEAESLALVVGRGLSLCAEEPLVWAMMKRLGVLERYVALPELVKGLPPVPARRGE